LTARAPHRASAALDGVFGALADPTRRGVVQTLLSEGSISVPALSAQLPISRQAVAKHVATLEQAGLLERLPARGREVRYGLRGEAIAPAAAWLNDAGQAWDARLGRLKRAVEPA
jgi:DNA-binding transcriptional ArsR family regulator